MSELEALEKFVLFTKTAKTRSGTAFVFDAFSPGRQEQKETTAKGRIFQKGPSEEFDIPFEIEWDLKGNALVFGKQFDLVIEDSFDDA